MAVKLHKPGYDDAKRSVSNGKVMLDDRDDWSEHRCAPRARAGPRRSGPFTGGDSPHPRCACPPGRPPQPCLSSATAFAAGESTSR